MLNKELVKNLKKTLTSWQKAKVTSCILPQRNSNSVEKLIRYNFIHKGVLLIYEELPDLSIYIASLVSSLEQMNGGTSYEVSIFCSTHFYHLLFLTNFPGKIKKVNYKYNNKFIPLNSLARWLATSNDFFDCNDFNPIPDRGEGQKAPPPPAKPVFPL